MNTSKGKHACLTPQPDVAVELGIELLDESLISALNWSRISKTSYEVECIKKANEIAAKGHLAAQKGFLQGFDERKIHNLYLQTTHHTEEELPYGNIIAFNEKAAVLHYQHKRVDVSGCSFLIDAGARYLGYCADITRTHFTEKIHPVFKEIHGQLNHQQQKLCSLVLPGKDYEDIQEKTHKGIAEILLNVGLIKDVSISGSIESGITSTFFPHGVGHALGIQVHDVAGKQIDEQGTPAPTNQKHPFLRTLRDIQNDDVLTIEPGIYFIPLLLNKAKDYPETNKFINWDLVEELAPCGGIRIEDNIWASKDGPINLTRPYLP